MEEKAHIPQVRAKLEPLSEGAIEAMHALKRQRFERRVRKISKGDLTSDAEKAAIACLKLASANGMNITDEELKKKMSCHDPVQFLDRFYDKVAREVDYFKRAVAEKMGFSIFLRGFFKDPDFTLDRFVVSSKFSKKKPIKKIHDDIFGTQRRLYFRLKDESDSLVQDQVVDYLKKALGEGSSITDEMYRQGLIVDQFNRPRKIGALLDSKMSYEECLRQGFEQDPALAAREVALVLFQSAIDIQKIAHIGGDISLSHEELLLKAFQEKPRLAANSLAVTLSREGVSVTNFRYINSLRNGTTHRKESLRQAFQEDLVHAAQDLVVVLSRHPLDVARASYKRGWESCLADTGAAVEAGIKDASEGVIIAYLVKGDDPDLSNPLARVMIKPYHLMRTFETETTKKKVPVVFRAFKPIGWYHPGFYKAIVDFVEEKLNKNSLSGEYRLPESCEAHKEAKFTIQFSSDLRMNLALLNERYTIEKDGTISMMHINLKGKGLNVLPDFSAVRVRHTFDCSDNNIYSLKGAPVSEMDDYFCKETMIFTFEGAPRTVRDQFSYLQTPYLSSLAGVPQAKTYIYGNHEAMGKNLRTDRPLVRALDKDLFPRFRTPSPV